MLQDLEVDAVFLDIQMPGLTGLDLAQVLSRFRTPPPIVFVTAHEEHAGRGVRARRGRLRPQAGAGRAPRRGRTPRGRGRRAGAVGRRPDRRRARRRDPLRAALRHHPRRGPGRLRPPAHQRGHAPGPHPAVDPGEEWAPAGFVRIHRSLLVALAHIERGPHRRRPRARCVVAGQELAVSRRHTRELRDLLTRRASRERARETGPGPRHRPPRRRTSGVRPTASREIDADTELGDVYMRSLLRAQLRLAAGVLVGARAHGRGAPAALPPLPAPQRGAGGRRAASRGCCSACWSTPGCSPGLDLRAPGRAQRARLHRPGRRPGDRREEGGSDQRPRHRRGRPRHGGDPGDRHLRAALLPHHHRLLRRLPHGRPGAQRRARSAASTSPPPPSSASPGWCSSSAPTCSGTRSAGPPATSCCSCSWPPRCAAPAPTRCRTSPRPGSPRGGAPRRSAARRRRSAGSTCCPSSRAPG